MKTKLLTLFFFILFLDLISAASVTKIEGIDHTVRFIEFDSNGVAYIIAEDETLSQSLYRLTPDNTVKLLTSVRFNSTITLKVSSKDEPYVFDFNEDGDINIWIWNPESSKLSKPITYSQHPDASFASFFDNGGNLFFNAETGINVLRYNEIVPVNISRLNGYRILSNKTHAIDQYDMVYMGVAKGDQETVARIVKEEIDDPDPYPEFINTIIERKALLKEMIVFNGRVYFVTKDTLIRFTDDNTYIVYESNYGPIDHLYATDKRLFFSYAPYNPEYCRIPAYLNLDDKRYTMDAVKECDFYQTCDKAGDTFIGETLSDELLYLKHNESKAAYMMVPNSLTLFGITASENGDVWLMAYNLYVIPQGTLNATRAFGSPHLENAVPMKARKNTNEVLFGTEKGLFVGLA